MKFNGEQLKILTLHALGDPREAPSFLANNLVLLQSYFPQHIYLYHDVSLPLPSYMVDIQWDAIILDVTFLTARWAGTDFFSKRLAEYAFVADSSALKIALPQDEYDCNEVLDDWMCDWNIDVLYSVISASWDKLYPRYHLKGKILLGYTGYIDESLIDRPLKPFEVRSKDIGYRTRKLPPYFGRTGEIKWRIGEAVALHARRHGLAVDIKLGASATLPGDAWLGFLGDTKFALGANSGSSLLDPRGYIQRGVRDHLSKNPLATFEEVEASVFPGLDGEEMTAISPRVFEAALMGCAQILVKGHYSGLVRPYEDYIPINADATDFDLVLAAMQDPTLVSRMIRNSRDAILSVDSLRARNRGAQLLALIGENGKRSSSTSKEIVESAIERYKTEMPQQYLQLWSKLRAKQMMYRVVSAVPGGLSLARIVKRNLATIRK